MMKIKLSVILFTVLVMVAVNSNSAEISPTDDMYTDPNHSGQHPTEQLWVANYTPSGHFERIMMKFDLEAYMGQTVDEAILHIYRFFGCPSGGVTSTIMYNVSVDWDEDTWPENVHIEHGDTEYGWYNFEVNGWYELDITEIVQAWLNREIENYGFVLKATPGSKFSKFYSREANETLKPYLELSTLTSVDDDRLHLPSEYCFHNYPNPFNSTTTLSYSIPENSEVKIEIYNLIGQRIAVLVDTFKDAGNYSIVWNGDSWPSGVFFAKITASDYTQTKRLLMLK